MKGLGDPLAAQSRVTVELSRTLAFRGRATKDGAEDESAETGTKRRGFQFDSYVVDIETQRMVAKSYFKNKEIKEHRKSN